MRDYSALSREELEQRLDIAEDVCVMYGWSGSDMRFERHRAAFEIWSLWLQLSGNDLSREANPHLSNDLISRLAARRTATADQMLARIRDKGAQ